MRSGCTRPSSQPSGGTVGCSKRGVVSTGQPRQELSGRLAPFVATQVEMSRKVCLGYVLILILDVYEVVREPAGLCEQSSGRSCRKAVDRVPFMR